MITDSFKYLVSLDSLLDARLGAISLLDPGHAKTLIDNGYTSRKNDRDLVKSSRYTPEQFSKTLTEGNIAVLQHALPTKLTNYIYESIYSAHVEGIIGTTVNRHHIVVNTHPYALNSVELEALKEIIELKVPNVESVTTCSVPLHFITPGYLRANEITHFIQYDLTTWLNFFVEPLMNDPIPSVIMICPKLLTKEADELDDAELAKELLKTFCPFAAMELQFVMYIALRFIDVEYFSVVLPKKTA